MLRVGLNQRRTNIQAKDIYTNERQGNNNRAIPRLFPLQTKAVTDSGDISANNAETSTTNV